MLALLATTYVRVPGPGPGLYVPVWYTDKFAAAVAAGVAVLGSAVGVVVTLTAPGGPVR